VTFDEDTTLKKPKRCHIEEVYEEEPVIPNTTMREVPRAAELVREVVTSPDEELLEDHDIVEVKEPPHMMILHKINPSYSRWREVWCSPRNHETGEKTKAILQLYGFDV
jgi:hypothetical protein